MISKISKSVEASAVVIIPVGVAVVESKATESKLNFKTEIEKNKISEISFEKQVCKNCGSDSRWQPRKSNQWKCVTCDPPKNPAMIARIDPDTSPKESSPGRTQERSDAITTRWGPWEICHQKPMCPHCHSSHVLETQFLDSVRRSCTTCGHIYTSEEFWLSHDRPVEIKSWIWNRNVLQNS